MNESQKEKKITVKFFLNQAVEPLSGGKGLKYYPLYIQVTYNRKNMQFKSQYGLSYKNLKEVPSPLMAFEDKLLNKIIRHEAKGNDSDYELKGLKRKYDVYSASVYQALEEYLKPLLRLAILKTGNELINVLDFYQSQSTVNLLYKAAAILFPTLDNCMSQKLTDDLEAYGQYQKLQKEPVLLYEFPTIIDWLEGSHKADLFSTNGTHKKKNNDSIKKTIALIDNAVRDRLKRLEG